MKLPLKTFVPAIFRFYDLTSSSMLLLQIMEGLHSADYAIFIVFLLVSTGIGVYYAFTGGRQRTTAEFLMGNRRLGVMPIMLSLYMSSVSAIYIMIYSAVTQLWPLPCHLATKSTCLDFSNLLYNGFPPSLRFLKRDGKFTLN